MASNLVSHSQRTPLSDGFINDQGCSATRLRKASGKSEVDPAFYR